MYAAAISISSAAAGHRDGGGSLARWASKAARPATGQAVTARWAVA
jgi:hypothetical protein